MLSNFPHLVKNILGDLPQDDYPVLNSFLFVSTWLNFALDQSQTSMRSLFKRLNVRGIKADLSTFSKASKNRDPLQFYHWFLKLRKKLKSSDKQQSKQLALFPLDSTIVT